MYNLGLVSIITPMHNSATYIKQTIESVMAQTYPYFEMIIVDDGSADCSTQIVKSFNDSRIKLIETDVSFGAAHARNIALKSAKGKWVAFLDSDDLWVPEKLEYQIKFMVQNSYHFSYGYYRHIDEFGKEIGIEIRGPKKINENMMKRTDYIGCLTVMYDRDIIGEIQIDDRILKRNDYAIWLKISKIASCYIYDGLLGFYRIRSHSISRINKLKLLKHHFLLFLISENRGIFYSIFATTRNVFFWFFKKIKYTKKYVRV